MLSDEKRRLVNDVRYRRGVVIGDGYGSNGVRADAGPDRITQANAECLGSFGITVINDWDCYRFRGFSGFEEGAALGRFIVASRRRGARHVAARIRSGRVAGRVLN